MREVRPADALTDQCDLGLRLDRHLRFDLGDNADDARAGELRERGAAVAENPRVAVLIGPDRPGQPHVRQGPCEHVFRARDARVLEVVLHAVEGRLRLRVLDLEARDDQRPCPIGSEDERDRPLGRDEREACVVEDVVRVEEHDTRQAGRLRVPEQRVAACPVLVGRDRDRRHHGVRA